MDTEIELIILWGRLDNWNRARLAWRTGIALLPTSPVDSLGCVCLAVKLAGRHVASGARDIVLDWRDMLRRIAKR